MTDSGLQKNHAEIITQEYNIIQADDVVQDAVGITGTMQTIRIASKSRPTNIMIQVENSEYS